MDRHSSNHLTLSTWAASELQSACFFAKVPQYWSSWVHIKRLYPDTTLRASNQWPTDSQHLNSFWELFEVLVFLQKCLNNDLSRVLIKRLYPDLTVGAKWPPDCEPGAGPQLTGVRAGLSAHRSQSPVSQYSSDTQWLLTDWRSRENCRITRTKHELRVI